MIARFASVAVVAFLSFVGSLVSDAQAETAAQRRPAEQRLPAATSGGKIFIQTGKPVVSRNNVDLKGKAGPGNPPGVALNGKAGPGTSDLKGKAGPGNPPGVALNGKAGPGTSDIKGKAGPGNPPGAAALRVGAQSAR